MSTAGSDGEWYLRRCAEDEVLAGQRSVLGDRANALIAVGMISADTALRVVDLYRRARELRGLEEREGDQGTSTVRAVMPPPPRITAYGRTIEQPWGTVTVHYVVSNTEQTSISVTIRSSSHSAVLPGGTYAGGQPSLTVTDDRGRRHQAHLTGGGTNVDWLGSYVITPPLPPDAKWLRIFGRRIELTDGPSDVTVALEILDQDDSVPARAERHLIRLAESGGQHRAPDAFPVAVETLVDCGALPETAEVVTQGALFSDALAGASVPPALVPQRWRSVLAGRGRRGGPAGTRTIGVTTPLFDGIRVSVLALRSREDDFEIDFEANGNVGRPALSSPWPPDLTVAAVDDREQHYLGEFRQFGHGRDGVNGTVAFCAPLDPSAENLNLLIPMTTARAVVRVPLRWDGTA